MTAGVPYLARMSRLASPAGGASRAARGEPATLRPSRPPFRDYGYPSPGMEGIGLAGSMGLPPGNDPGVPDGPVSAARGGEVRRQAAGSPESGAVPEALGGWEARSSTAGWTEGGTDVSQGAVSRPAEAGLARGAVYAAGNGRGAGSDLGSGGAWGGPGAGDGLGAGGPGADGDLGAGSGLDARGTGSAVGAKGRPDVDGSRVSGPAAAGSTAAAAVSRTGHGNGWGSHISDARWASPARGPSERRDKPGSSPDWAVAAPDSATPAPASHGSRSSQPDGVRPGVSIGTIEVTVLPPAPSPPDPGLAEPPHAQLAADTGAGAGSGGGGGLRAGLRRWHGIAQG
jgi:hypothetical protein